MNSLEYAVLENGRKIPYIMKTDPPRGGMKHTYFAPDKSYVVQFFNDRDMAHDAGFHARLKAIIGKYNPTLSEEEGGAKGNTKQMAEYFKKRFCWPMDIVKYPEFGIVCPAYPSNFFFDENASAVLNLKGKDKKSNWFTEKNKRYLNKEEKGDFRRILYMGILLSRAIRRMHQAGLAHSDLSNNNVLIDPKRGECVVIDIDSLVVPGVFPPEVNGTMGYMAPEVMGGYGLPYGHENRKYPSIYTDLHALPVLLYEYFFCRHPLKGPKIYSHDSPSKDNFFALGPKATFIEHTTDDSNRPANLNPTIQDLGPDLEKLFLRAFMDGLHTPELRPSAMEWEKALSKTYDLLHKCKNNNCEKQWFVFYDTKKTVCPFCHKPLRGEDIARIGLKKELKGASGQYLKSQEIDIGEQKKLYQWHIISHCFPDEKTAPLVQSVIKKQEGIWRLENKEIKGLISPEGKLVSPGQSMVLKNGSLWRASGEKGAMLMEFSIWHLL